MKPEAKDGLQKELKELKRLKRFKRFKNCLLPFQASPSVAVGVGWVSEQVRKS
jgi:hypothetical protein